MVGSGFYSVILLGSASNLVTAEVCCCNEPGMDLDCTI